MPWYVNGDFNKLFMWTVNLQNPSKQTNKKSTSMSHISPCETAHYLQPQFWKHLFMCLMLKTAVSTTKVNEIIQVDLYLPKSMHINE